jgi:hypothetical protein
MKRILVLITILISGLSCHKLLDTQPLNTISGSQVWSSTGNAQDFIFQTYATVTSDIIAGGGEGPGKMDAYTLNTLGFDDIYNGSYAVFSGTLTNYTDMGFNKFAGIRQCNMIIDNVQASTGISASDKVPLIAEGKFLRALQYFNLARKFGKVVWIDTTLVPGQDLRLPTTANPAETYGHIIQDLQDAIAGLPATAPAGRASKYTAAAILSEACLQAAAYSNYPNGPDLNSAAVKSLLQTAVTSANSVITEGGYSLESDYGSMFNDVKPTSPEIILAAYKTALNTTCDQTPMQTEVANVNNDRITQYGGSPLFNASVNIFEAWIQHGPTENLADDYLVIDKSNAQLALPWNQTSQFKAAVSNTTRPSLTDVPHASSETDMEYGIVSPVSGETMWTLTNTGRDARWAASIVSDSCGFFGQTVTTCIRGNSSRWMKINGIGYYVSLTNQYWRKGIYNVSPRVYVGVPTDYHYVITRLGRVYLNLAEAYLLQGNIADAVTALNKTRTVHGKLPASTASDAATAWADYKRERRVELTLEGDYYWSLLRWGMFGGDANHGNAQAGDIPELDVTPTVLDISRDRMGYVITKGAYFSQNNQRHFDYPRRYLFPIPQDQINQNGRLQQNQGW